MNLELLARTFPLARQVASAKARRQALASLPILYPVLVRDVEAQSWVGPFALVGIDDMDEFFRPAPRTYTVRRWDEEGLRQSRFDADGVELDVETPRLLVASWRAEGPAAKVAREYEAEAERADRATWRRIGLPDPVQLQAEIDACYVSPTRYNARRGT